MSYDVIRSVRQLIESGVGDVARLAYILDRLENGKYIYLSDQRYLESLLNTNEYIVNKPSVAESPVVNLGKDLRDINLRLENILQNKTRNEKIATDHALTPQMDSTPRSPLIEGMVRHKSEDITILLSVVLGLITLQGIGHIYIGKIAKGAGILILSLILSSFSVSYFLGLVKNSLPSFLNFYLPFIMLIGYFGLYVFQILDSRRLCATYNAYVLEHGKTPPWW